MIEKPLAETPEKAQEIRSVGERPSIGHPSWAY